MIIFEKISYRNFLSYGNAWNTYDFQGKTITRIKGENGQGKSSCIVDPLYYALFGRPYRKQKLDQLINWTNKKELEVKLWFRNGNKRFIIHRGMKPSIFHIFEGLVHDDDDDLTVVPVNSTNTVYQKILEEEILHMNEEVFNQTVIKSMTKSLSFMTLYKHEKRTIVESIFGIEIFTHMNTLLTKTKLTEVTSEIEILLEKIQGQRNLIEGELSNLESLKQIKEKMSAEKLRKLTDIQGEIEELQQRITQYNIGLDKIKKRKAEKEELDAELGGCIKEAKIKKKSRQEVQAEIAVMEKKIDLFATSCPECPKVKTMMADENLEEKKLYSESLAGSIVDLKGEFDRLTAQIAKCDKVISNERFVVNSKEEAKVKVEKLKTELDREKSEDEVVKIDETRLKKLKKDMADLEKEYNEKNKKKRHFQVLKQLLADEGIKSFIIKRYLPHVNKILNTYLQKFNADILFYFDTEFNDVIGSRYKENANYHCFSEGQKRRIDMAILFTFLEFCKIKNRKSETNLLILDEITAGVDGSGENILYDILRDMVNVEDKEVITVSHSGNIDADKLDRCFEVKLEHGFSVLNLLES